MGLGGSTVANLVPCCTKGEGKDDEGTTLKVRGGTAAVPGLVPSVPSIRGFPGSGPAWLEKYRPRLQPEECSIAEALLRDGQGHLFEGFADADIADVRRLLEQAVRLDQAYPGGILQYTENARGLLKASKEGANPFLGYTPSVPSGCSLEHGTAEFEKMEKLGVAEARLWENTPSSGYVFDAGKKSR